MGEEEAGFTDLLNEVKIVLSPQKDILDIGGDQAIGGPEASLETTPPSGLAIHSLDSQEI